MKPPEIRIASSPVKQVKCSKSLGVLIDETLSWSNHVDNTCKKISKAIFGLKLARPFVPHHLLLQLYNSLVLPLFDYCDVVWGNINKGLVDRLQKLHNRAARIITRSDYSIRSSEVLRRLQWDNLEVRRTKHMATLMYKIFNGKAPKYLNNFLRLCDVTHHNLRGHELNIILPKARTDYKRNSFAFKGIKIWNSLPLELRKSNSTKEFRRRLDSYFSAVP